MRWDQIDEQPCSVARTLSVIGDRWTLLIIRDAFLKIRRFEDFQKNLGISRHRLSDRLKKLVEAGVFEKRPYQESPARYEYRLTEKGLELHPIVVAMVQWGNRWMDQGKGAPIVYQHKTCGQVFTPVLTCAECHEPLTPRDMKVLPGPGFHQIEAALQEQNNKEHSS